VHTVFFDVTDDRTTEAGSWRGSHPRGHEGRWR
jgi:hypothetical protein